MEKKDIGQHGNKNVAKQLAVNKMLQILLRDMFEERETITYANGTEDMFPTRYQELDGFSTQDINSHLTNNDNKIESSIDLLNEMCKYFNLPLQSTKGKG